MSEQFSGTVRVLNTSSGSPTVVLEGGDDESGGNITLGGQGQSGDLSLLDGSNRQRIFISASSRPFLRFDDESGVSQIILEGDTGNILIQGKLFFGGLGGIELSSTNVQVLLQAAQTINTFSQRIQSLENREQVLMQQVAALTQQVASLTGRINTLEQQGSSGGGTSDFVISVEVEQGQFVITGSGFRPSVRCFIIVVYPDLSRKVFEDTPNSEGKLNFKKDTSSLCIAGANLTLNFTVNQPDTSGGDQFTNTVSKSCPN